jgi:hypothetical protein
MSTSLVFARENFVSFFEGASQFQRASDGIASHASHEHVQDTVRRVLAEMGPTRRTYPSGVAIGRDAEDGQESDTSGETPAGRVVSFADEHFGASGAPSGCRTSRGVSSGGSQSAEAPGQSRGRGRGRARQARGGRSGGR